ncbi:MFS transporter, partial [Xylella fastidiosa subsp. multiplex]|nr:MFS transporter [Xylella fastidiosa subsp. multiplex]
GPLMGVFTDRLRRKPLMQVANVARFVILGSLPLAAALDHLTVAHLYAAALLKGVFDVVFQLAYQAYLPQLLAREDLI